VSVICDDQKIQAELPQFILISDKMCSKKDVDCATGSMPSRVHVWREKSGWINIPIFAKMVRLIGARLRAAAPEAKPFLIMDAHKVHYALPVLRAARLFGVTVLIIPATCTHVLQMLDTDVFARFKSVFRNRLQQHQCVGANADLPCTTILAELGGTIREVVQESNWTEVFRKNGFGRGEPFARPSLLQSMEYESMPQLPGELPSYAAFCGIFPRGAVIPFDLLLSSTRDERRRSEADIPIQERPAAYAGAQALAWRFPLRPRRSPAAVVTSTKLPLHEGTSGSVTTPAPPLPPPPGPPPGVRPVPILKRLGSSQRL
jgi:hypothetical protein